MSVKEKVIEAKTNLDSLIPPLPPIHDYHQINVTIPEPKIHIQNLVVDWTLIDSMFSAAMIMGFILVGMYVRTVMR